MSVVVTRARGHHAKPYVVAEFLGAQMRIAHVVSFEEATAVKREWSAAYYAMEPGTVRTLNFQPTETPA